MNQKQIVVSGMRSTDFLHLGHYFGVIQNWLQLQQQYEAYFFAADWHALTTDYQDPSQIKKFRRDNIIDWIACGVDPAKATLYIQSDVKEVLELNLLLSMITPLGWLERNPTYKEQQEQLTQSADGGAQKAKKDVSGLGFLAYPVLQAADIAIVRGELVPVGEDQIPHLELNREMLRRFVHLYKKKIFPEPKPLLTKVSKLLGTDNRKMSKSYGNSILLSEPAPSVEKKIKSMVTDTQKVKLGDAGRPEVCNVYSYHNILATTGSVGAAGADSELEGIAAECRSGALSCGQCKMQLAKKMNEFLEPIRNKKAQLTSDPKFVDDILAEGAKKVRMTAQQVMEETRAAMGI